MKIKDIKNIVGEKYLERFKVYNPVTLFEPNWDALLERRCPICGNKLKIPRTNRIAYCHGRKHVRPFFLSIPKLQSIELRFGNGLPLG